MMTDIHVTERTSFKLCRQYWDFAYVQGLTALKKSTGPSWFGTGIHFALATYYRDKMIDAPEKRHPKDVFKTWFYREFTEDEWNGLYLDEQTRLEGMLELGIDMMTRYVPWAEINDNFEILGVEIPLRYEVIPGVCLVGSIDLLVRNLRTGKIWVVDHKTCASFIDPETLNYDDQMMVYLWLVWKVYDEVPGGALYSMLRKHIPSQPVLLKDGTRFSKAAGQDTTKEIFLEAIHANGFNPSDYTDILTKLESNEFFRRESIVRSRRELEILTPQLEREAEEMTREWIPIYPTLTRDCVWSCDYKDLCRTRLSGGDVEFTIAGNYRVQSEDEKRLRWLEAREQSSEPGVVNGASS